MRTPPLRAPIEGLTIYPVRSDDDAAAAIGWLTQGHPIVAVDTETTGLDYHAEVRLVQLGDYQVAWVGGGQVESSPPRLSTERASESPVFKPSGRLNRPELFWFELPVPNPWTQA